MRMRWRSLLLAPVVVLVIACSIPQQTPAPTIAASPTAGADIPLRGLVTRVDGGPAGGGARVCAGRASAATPSCATAGGDGTASLFGSAGTYFVRVSGPAEQRWQETTRV